MKYRSSNQRTVFFLKRELAHSRQGSVASFLAIMMLPLLGLLALFVDYGYLLYVRTDMQRAADQAALAAVVELVPDSEGNQDFEGVARVAAEYVRQNLGEKFTVRSEDIEIGRYNPQTVYTNLELVSGGVADTVRLTIRRDTSANSSVSLYFARLFDSDAEDITATSAAILQRGRFIKSGSDILPFALPDNEWNKLGQGDEFVLYGDGQVRDGTGQKIPGNWGTLDIGSSNNSTNDLKRQILDGLSQGDLNGLASSGAIPSSSHIDSQIVPMTLEADTGLSSGMENALDQVEGQTKIVPIFDQNKVGNSAGGKKKASGDNLIYEIVGWAVVKVVDSQFHGAHNTNVTVEKSYTYDGTLEPIADLSQPGDGIEGAFTSPVLAQ